jgi:hypothetical protein
MAKQTFTTGQVLTAAQVNSLQTNDFNQTVSAKTASYVLVAADKGTRIEFSTSGSVTCTVNTGLFDAGDTVYIQNTGAGVVTITAGTATVNTSATLAVNQYEGGVLYFISPSSAIWFEYASSATGDITGITTGATSGLTGGVTSGTADLKFNTTAKGGLLVGTGSGTVTELTVGSNNTVLTADSTTASGLKWATASSGISILGQKTITAGINYTTTSTTQTAVNTTNFRVSITTGSSTTIVVILKGTAQIAGGAINSWSVSLGAGTTYEMVACNASYIGVNEACTVHIVTGLTANTAYNVDWTFRTNNSGQAAQIIGDSSNQYPRMVVLG